VQLSHSCLRSPAALLLQILQQHQPQHQSSSSQQPSPASFAAQIRVSQLATF
jgi:hypothetical protein